MVLEAAGDRAAAVPATVAPEMIGPEGIPVALDDQLAAVRAVGALVRLVVDVADVDVLQPLVPGRDVGPQERLVGRRRHVEHAEVGVERREVQRHLIADVPEDPAAHPADILRVVVVAGDDEVRDLEPDVRLLPEPLEGVEHRLEVRVGDLAIELLGERLQVDVRGVHDLEERPAGLRCDVAGGDGDRLDAPLAAGLRGVDGVLGPDHRVVVGEGDALAAVVQGRLGDGPGHRQGAEALDLARLGDVPVLAELAAEVAAGGAEGQHAGAGVEVVERLLLDRVDAEAGAPAVGRQHHLAAEVLADEAEAAVAGLEVALARAEVADDPPVLRMPPAARQRPVGPQPGAGGEIDDRSHGPPLHGSRGASIRSNRRVACGPETAPDVARRAYLHFTNPAGEDRSVGPWPAGRRAG